MKHYRGSITQATTHEMIEMWLDVAEVAEKEDCELIVFKIPQGSNAVEQIERFLQEKFNPISK